ncbi:hypothetical protein CMQ_2460 [Grosmannia clavigera kw1407]|uniref:Uncharacterized protein n=1 Tax=Grosmannia clavigera (strain kw1407 / UAMH 11150) TaxID=655863 RepID=F0XIY6_GROCL|nr:uncharacterized protein CMQ_2460 [Grosmannia clavigera kw1407]EFX02411.1 hypothetical protein CMQ_2460 [Grosmannia clavigera kw1407]
MIADRFQNGVQASPTLFVDRRPTTPTSPGRLDRLDEKRMTVDAIIDRAQGVEQQLSLSLSKSPLDVLLTPPDELDDDDDDEVSVSDSGLESVLSTRTVSLESMPSLSDSVATGTVSSLNSPCSPHRGAGCRARPKHRSLTPVSSPPGKRELHPLAFNTGSDSNSDDDVDELDFRVFHPLPDALAKTAAETRSPLQPLRSAFKSNLTASLRALRNAARSFSTLNLTSVPPENFLTRSILTIDPHIPYTDERRPPPLEEEPSPALRRYLNPTSSARIDSRQPITPQALSPALASASLSPSPGTVALLSSVLGPNENATSDRPAFTASIQMHTYKVHRSRSLSAASASAAPPASTSTSPSRSSTAAGPSGSSARSLPATDERPFPGPRQRELRENSDFIRVAVMEMAMRRLGKLDDRRPGRARLALPPRKASTRPYVIGANGVPARWVGTTVDGLSW